MLRSKFLVPFLLISLGCSTQLASQDYNRKISISEWIEEMENSKDSIYQLENTEIYYDFDKDSLYSWRQPRTPAEDTLPSRPIHIKPLVVLENCQLPVNQTSVLSHLVFHNNVIISSCTGGLQMIFYDNTFKQGLELRNSELGVFQFTHSSILQRVAISELRIDLLSFTDCSLSTDPSVPESIHNYGFEAENQNYQYLFRLDQSQKMINWFYLADCKILPTEVTPVISFKGGKYDGIVFQGMDFNKSIIDFNGCSVKEDLSIYECKFNQPLGVNKFDFPLDNTSFQWSQLDSAGLGLYTDYAVPPFSNRTDSLSSDVYIFNALNSSYRKFFSMYRTQGDTESANACYKQMKDMETAKYRHFHRQSPQLQTWFNWRFNQFLKYFSEYGTSPVQSLIVSMWTILIFAAVYFFFPSDWDRIDRAFLINQHRKIMDYFRSEQRLEDFYTAQHKEEFKAFEEYREEIKRGNTELPAFILALGQPLYLLSVIKHKFLTLIYRRTEVLRGRWIDLKPARKAYVSTMTVLSILFYLFYLILVRTLNSITLSINVFSTLGFGAIPVKGITRYITIVEGFLGWFLLSIFSVSLIGQMLQN